MLALSAVHYGMTGEAASTTVLASFGASAVLVGAAPAVPFSQPRNVIGACVGWQACYLNPSSGGHVISAAIGVATMKLLGPDAVAIAAPLAVSTSVMAMMATGTVHPPGTQYE